MDKSSSISFGGIRFPRNGVLASGILGVTGWSMAQAAKSGAGGITSKSISKDIRKGYQSPVIQVYKAGVINAVGLSSTGINNSNKELYLLSKTNSCLRSSSGSNLNSTIILSLNQSLTPHNRLAMKRSGIASPS